jgi:hypothetical protein
MGVWILQEGRWQHSEDRIIFIPKDKLDERYEGTEIAHKAHRFLSFTTDAAPSIVIPVEDTKRELDGNPNTLPPYVFFRISKELYDRETRTTYPFRFKRKKGTSRSAAFAVSPSDSRRRATILRS